MTQDQINQRSYELIQEQFNSTPPIDEELIAKMVESRLAAGVSSTREEQEAELRKHIGARPILFIYEYTRPHTPPEGKFIICCPPVAIEIQKIYAYSVMGAYAEIAALGEFVDHSFGTSSMVRVKQVSKD